MGVSLLTGEYCKIFWIKSRSWGSLVCKTYVFGEMYFLPRLRRNLGKILVFLDVIFMIHLFHFRSRRSSKNLDNFKELIKLWIAQKWRLPIYHLNDHTAYRPHINLRRIVSCPKDQLRSPIASWADISNISFSFNKFLRRPKITNDNSMSNSINQYILRFDVPMCNRQGG